MNLRKEWHFWCSVRHIMYTHNNCIFLFYVFSTSLPFRWIKMIITPNEGGAPCRGLRAPRIRRIRCLAHRTWKLCKICIIFRSVFIFFKLQLRIRIVINFSYRACRKCTFLAPKPEPELIITRDAIERCASFEIKFSSSENIFCKITSYSF